MGKAHVILLGLLRQEFSTEGSFVSQGHLARLSQLGCHKCVCVGEFLASKEVEALDVAKHPSMHRTAPGNKKRSSQKLSIVLALRNWEHFKEFVPCSKARGKL